MGSNPGLEPGRHLINLFIESHRPLEKPCFCNASIVYTEQVGVNLHLLPKNGLKAH